MEFVSEMVVWKVVKFSEFFTQHKTIKHIWRFFANIVSFQKNVAKLKAPVKWTHWLLYTIICKGRTRGTGGVVAWEVMFRLPVGKMQLKTTQTRDGTPHVPPNVKADLVVFFCRSLFLLFTAINQWHVRGVSPQTGAIHFRLSTHVSGRRDCSGAFFYRCARDAWCARVKRGDVCTCFRSILD